MDFTKTAARQAGQTIHKLATEFRNAKAINPQEFKELTNNRLTRADEVIAVSLLDDPRIQDPQRAQELLNALRDQDSWKRHNETHGHGSATLEAAASGAGYWARRKMQGLIDGVKALVKGPNRQTSPHDPGPDGMLFYKNQLSYDDYVAACKRRGTKPESREEWNFQEQHSWPNATNTVR